MKRRYLNALLFLVLVVGISFVGFYLGKNMMHQGEHPHSNATEWHTLLHRQLDLTNQQELELAKLEKVYLQHKKQLKIEMHNANKKLADALSADKSYSSNVQTSVDEIHHIMGEIQKKTIQHLLEIRPILTPEQNIKLEQMITDALYQKQ
tara:strand:- start:37811 stop:38260 length:450 start_codon:yes stop_codon:yes gene_type:complete